MDEFSNKLKKINKWHFFVNHTIFLFFTLITVKLQNDDAQKIKIIKNNHGTAIYTYQRVI